MRIKLSDVLSQTGGYMVIDGSMSTGLELLGCTMKDSLWTAKILAEDPDKVKEVHLSYFRAGADCGITCSYQATMPGLMAHGYSQKEAEEIIVRSVQVFLEARDEWWEKEGKAANRVYPICLAGCGPFGAYLADGSEYRGHYGVYKESLREFHQHRAELLWQAGADMLLFETEPSLPEALVEADVAEELGADYWISFSCQNGILTNEGNSLTECAKILSHDHPHLRMLGVNCTPPQFMTEAITALRKGTDLPIGVYPNSGEIYDAVTKTWHGEVADQQSFGELAKLWYQAGASAVGGCCRTAASHIKQVYEVKEKLRKVEK
jgi:homocysteine S-methyltransferase